MIKTDNKAPRSEAPKIADVPWWKTVGMFYAGGWHPLGARIRRQIPNEFIEDDYAWEYTEEHVLCLKELGVTLLVTQADRGLSDADQAADVELARQQAERCHKHGLRHGSYMANTVYFESMLKEHLDCRDWVIKTHDGRFVHYGGDQTWRWVACFNSPGWRKRMKRQVEIAIRTIKTDWLHFDNLAVWPEPDSCHCTHCQRLFKEFLFRKYPTAELQRHRFGFPGLETFCAPNWYLRFSQPWEADRIQNPLMQDWIDFRCWTVTDYIRDMSQYAHELKPDIGMNSNGQGVWGSNQAFIHGVDPESQSAWVDVICDENKDFAADQDPRSPVRVERKMRTMNYYRRRGKQVWSHYNEEESLGFHLTFTGDPGINQGWGYAEPGKMPLNLAPPGVRELLDHHRRHVDLYTRVGSAARIAVWRNRQSLAYVSTDTHLSVCVMEQMLFFNRIPFSIVSDDYINDEKLRQFELLIVPDVEFIDQREIDTLTRFVEQGGSLLITERSGQFTSEPRRRRDPAFKHLFRQGLVSSSTSEVEAAVLDPNAQFVTISETGAPAFAHFGAGRVAYLPKIHYIHLPHAFKSTYNKNYDGIDSRYWKQPHNVAEILDSIRWLNPTCQPVIAYGPPELRLDYVCWVNGTRGVQLARVGPINAAKDVPFAVLGDAEPKEGRLFKPSQPEPIALRWNRRGAYFETILPQIMRHAVVSYR